MSENKFVGRGEELAKFIVSHLLDHDVIRIQVNIKALISTYDYNILDPEVQKHNFDFVLWAKNRKPIVFEINYHHKEKAAKKWNNVFVPLLVTAGYDYVTINDYDCRKRGMFWLDTKKVHPCITWDDLRDVIDALEIAGITTMYN